MQLPGGLCIDGEVRRDYAFRPVTGALELAIAESGQWSGQPARVTAALTAALAQLGGQVASWDVAHRLSVGDRQFLVRQLGAHLGFDAEWLSAHCRDCDAAFDFQVRHSAFPVKPAAESYPYTQASTSRGEVRLRVPSGADQEAVAGVEDMDAATRRLVSRLLVDGEAGDFSAEDIAAMEAALETAAPEVATVVQGVCPECGAENQVEVDPYRCLDRDARQIFAEIHALASAYHWSEAEIVSLPVARRKTYLRLVDQACGMRQ